MTSDRELLEAAAKAIGLRWSVADLVWYDDVAGTFVKNWNPLTDSGQALELAVKLGISTWHSLNGAYADHKDLPEDMSPCREDAREDRSAALRRAIVRAAAAIGEGKA